MREILFRGFHERADGDTTIFVDGREVWGRWVEGGYAEIAPPPVCFSSDPQGSTKVCIVAEQGCADWGMPRSYGMAEVLPSTVGQYTGLTDKNGRKIFEGDTCIVARFTDLYGYIKHEWGNSYFQNYNTSEKVTWIELSLYPNHVEVTGTIFDNVQEVIS